jgi:hypothetical protein
MLVKIHALVFHLLPFHACNEALVLEDILSGLCLATEVTKS